MATSGPNYPSSGTSIAGDGTAAWTNPGNITTDNGTGATNTRPTAHFLDRRVRLVRAGTVETTDKASATVWGTTYAYASYGGAADLWGAAWTVSDINDANFGAVLSCPVTGGTNTQYLKAVGFGFSIPGGSTINGILLEIKRKSTGGGKIKTGDVDAFRITITYTASGGGNPQKVVKYAQAVNTASTY